MQAVFSTLLSRTRVTIYKIPSRAQEVMLVSQMTGERQEHTFKKECAKMR